MWNRVLLTIAAMTLATLANAQEVHSIDEPDIRKPVLQNRVRASYTPEAWERRIEGTVMLTAVIATDGSVQEVSVTQSLDDRYGLDTEAMKAVRQWTFTPGTKDNQPIAVRASVSIKFTLVRPEP